MSELTKAFEQTLKQIGESPDQHFVATELDDFCSSAMAKFMLGMQEHGGSIMNRLLLRETLDEIIDTNFYVRAIVFKRNAILTDLLELKKLMSQPEIEPKIDAIINKLRNL